MSDRPNPDAAHPLPATDPSLRERWDARQAELRERFDEPIERASRLTQRTLAWLPIRVWRHFLQHNGFLLAAGISYQSLFTIFAAIYLAFAVVGVWLGGDAQAVGQLIDLINSYIPNLISEHGLVKPGQVQEIADSSASLLTVTGGIALIVIVWTAIGFVTYARRAVRDTFGLPYDSRSYVLLKARDLIAALAFGVALVAGSVLVQMTTWALDLVFSLFGWTSDSTASNISVRVLTLVVAFAINALALALLFRFLTGTSLRWRRIWPGSLLGGGALALLQVGAGLLLVYTPSNPLLATFAIFIGFLLWFRINGIVILVAAAWIAVETSDRDLPLVQISPEERERRERHALRIAAGVHLRDARAELASASWWRRPAARRAVRRAIAELRALDAPPRPDADQLRLRDVLS
ncbi:YihY/virulence factor BrkB family protein [Microbacterium sp. cx-59]|uniref:YihY/virulence factor BrkB family protein n=1 Tax=Microbacterium sp. cx-59 TaxID=2891207 RepID=UPI001E51762B|nr:YihY/virulence factor BrkB family protein [Microbacterium sp. cx-59]MCC4907894.1 YihY/virulence factor BrkB family protein [Microbacterium sp. cx-59]